MTKTDAETVPAARKANILVIDDEQGIRDLLSYELSLQGYAVSTAADGVEGASALRRRKADLVILDLKMPKRGGVETLEEIMSIDPDTEVIVATGYGTVETAVTCMKNGAYDYIRKPFDIEELSALVRKALEKKDLKIAVALYEAGRSLYSSLNLDELLEKTVDLVHRSIRSDELALMLYDGGSRLSLAASTNMEGRSLRRLSLGELLLAQSPESFEPVVFGGGRKVKDRRLSAALAKEGIRSILFSPLSTKAKRWGALVLIRMDAEEFSRTDVRNAALFSVQTAQAVENARLFADLERTVTELRDAGRNIAEINGFLESVIGSLTDALAVVGPDGTLVRTNGAFLELFGTQAPEPGSDAAPVMIGDLLPVERIFGSRFTARLAVPSPVVGVELECRCRGGRLVPLSVSASPVFDDENRCTGTVLLLRDISMQREAEKNLRHLASHDVLTDLPNRILLSDRVSQSVSRANRYRSTVAVMLLDLDRFKEANDSLGHEAGDLILKEVARRLKAGLREYDTVARIGGDEFAVVLSDITDTDTMTVIADRMLSSLGQPVSVNGRDIRISASIGISRYPEDGRTLDTLLRNADLALYRSKSAGGASYVFYRAGMGKAAENFAAVRTNLTGALERDEFGLYYQPLVDIETGRIVSAEALLRWVHPERGIMEPAHFIAAAESAGLMESIGEWVLRTACRRCMEWQHEGYIGFPVSVNISARQLYAPDLREKIFAVLRETGLPPGLLILEITENSIMQNTEHAARIIGELHRSGIRIHLDRFGSGYSSLNLFRIIPLEAVKIDKSFIGHITHDAFDAAFVKAVIVTAHSLNLSVTAAGVENTGQLDFIRSAKYSGRKTLKCDRAQGFLWSRPIPEDEFGRLLAAQKSGSLFPPEVEP